MGVAGIQKNGHQILFFFAVLLSVVGIIGIWQEEMILYVIAFSLSGILLIIAVIFWFRNSQEKRRADEQKKSFMYNEYGKENVDEANRLSKQFKQQRRTNEE